MKVRLVLPIYQYFQLTHEKGLKNRDIKITIYIFETHSSRIHTPVNQDYLSSPAADVKEYAIGTELRTRLGKWSFDDKIYTRIYIVYFDDLHPSPLAN